MSRNGSGTYAKVNTFVAGTTITASTHNANWDDLVSEMTNSVAADGQTSMTGPLKASSGSVSLPSLTFASDTDTGIYRIAGNNLGVAVGGTKVIDLTSSACNVVATIKQNGFALLPIGTVMPYAGSSSPTGYLLCDGSSLLRASYPDLFAVIGSTYGSADGTHFNVPDLRGRLPAGKDDMGGSAASRLSSTTITSGATTLGNSGGAETKTLLTANLPAYTPAGSISTVQFGNVFPASVAGSPNNGIITGAQLASTSFQSILNPGSQTFTGTAQGGTSTAFGLVQPTLILNYIIFAGV